MKKLMNRAGLIYLAATVTLVIVFARLGFWQLDRAAEKKQMLEHASQAQRAAPERTLAFDDPRQFLYREFLLRGKFDLHRQFLLDNRIHNKQAGFEVLTPFITDSEGHVILVNRGWVAHDGNRSLKTRIDVPRRDSDLISGLLTIPSRGFTLGDAIDGSQSGWPKVLQYLDYEAIGREISNGSVLPAVLVLAEDQPGSFAYNWRPVANGPHKHYGYAFQWFAMLLAVMTIFVYLNFIKKDE
ncbi:hypothetical protein AB833_30005 [Chromatiales bacterium (ex Bugula neritina AB1)]|nr:hypothetical protein AB833_30005 [Chromatiales bacterium (ex Bugula neritina AB1)]